jgi:anti-sigma regulatory factor (Ser/Thr protein kinase)
MVSDDHIRLELTSDAGVLSGVRDQIHDWALPRGWSNVQAAEVSLAVDEALTNVIRHAYGSRPGQPIELDLCSVVDPTHGEGLEVRIRDYGKQVDPAQIRGRSLDEVRPGGLGVHIIHAMMSAVSYEQAPGGGMLLIMRKYRDHVAGSGDPRGCRHE